MHAQWQLGTRLLQDLPEQPLPAECNLRLLSLLSFYHRKRLGIMQRSACACIGKRVSSSMDFPRSNLLRSASKAGNGAKVVVCLTFITAYPARSFFRSVDLMLPTLKSRMMSATEASQMSHVGFGHLEVFSKNEV